MSKRVLLLTLTAGGGHIQAAKAKRQELSDATVFERDLFYDWVGRWFGYIVKQAWGRAQTKGYVSVLIHLSAGASLCNRIFFLPFFSAPSTLASGIRLMS